MTRKEKNQRMQTLKKQIDDNIINNIEVCLSKNGNCTGQGLFNAIQGAMNVMFVRPLKLLHLCQVINTEI